MNILVLNGPNLNMLGLRKPEIYGTVKLTDIESGLRQRAKKKDVSVAAHQSNSEGTLINHIQAAIHSRVYKGILLNAGGYTHTSVALRDTVEIAKDVGIPTIEVHLSNTQAREDFRKHSFLTEVCLAKFEGEKEKSYFKALDYLIEYLTKQKP